MDISFSNSNYSTAAAFVQHSIVSIHYSKERYCQCALLKFCQLGTENDHDNYFSVASSQQNVNMNTTKRPKGVITCNYTFSWEMFVCVLCAIAEIKLFGGFFWVLMRKFMLRKMENSLLVNTNFPWRITKYSCFLRFSLECVKVFN